MSCSGNTCALSPIWSKRSETRRTLQGFRSTFHLGIRFKSQCLCLFQQNMVSRSVSIFFEVKNSLKIRECFWCFADTSTHDSHHRISSDFHFDKRSFVTTMPLHDATIETDPKQYPLHTSADATDGLQFLMRELPDWDLVTCREASFTIHSSFELPNAFDLSNFCDFDYQKALTVLIIPEVIFTDSALRSVDPRKRNCFFDGERELEYFKTYSKANCEMECLAEFTMQKCNCTTLNLVRNESTPLCHLKDMKCVRDRATPKGLRHCGCLERCNLINYHFEVRSDKLSMTYNPKWVFVTNLKGNWQKFIF